MSRIFNIKGHTNYCEDSDLANLFDVDVVVKGDGTAFRFFNLGRSIEINGAENQEQPLTMRVANGDTWMGLSYQLYGDVRYWWILAKLNKCSDATVDPEPGSDIYILTKSNVIEIVHSLKD